jgi:hypothetical protein
VYIDPKLMDDHQLMIELEATEEEIDLFATITPEQAEKSCIVPRITVLDASERLEELIMEATRRGLYHPSLDLAKVI